MPYIPPFCFNVTSKQGGHCVRLCDRSVSPVPLSVLFRRNPMSVFKENNGGAKLGVYVSVVCHPRPPVLLQCYIEAGGDKRPMLFRRRIPTLTFALRQPPPSKTPAVGFIRNLQGGLGLQTDLGARIPFMAKTCGD